MRRVWLPRHRFERFPGTSVMAVLALTGCLTMILAAAAASSAAAQARLAALP